MGQGGRVLGHTLAGGVAPGAVATGVAGAEADPDFLAGGQAGEIKTGFFADAGMLPVGIGAEGISGGELDLKELDDAGLAVALAGELALFVAHAELEAGGLVRHGFGCGLALHTQEGGLDFGFGGGELADLGGEFIGTGEDFFLGVVPRAGGHGDGIFFGAQIGFFAFQSIHLGIERGDLGGETCEDRHLGGGSEDGTDARDERGHGEVSQIKDDVEHIFDGLSVEDFLVAPRIVELDERIIETYSRFIKARHEGSVGCWGL